MKVRFNIYDEKECTYFKTNCKMIAVIPPNTSLTPEQVKEYYGIDEDHRYFEHTLNSRCKVQRYVFDKCVVPECDRYRIETVYCGR